MKAWALAGLAGMSGPSAAILASKPLDTTVALTVSVLWIAAFAYLAMATGAASTQVARHADWMLTTPLLIADLGVSAGAPAHEILIATVADVLMIASGYMAVSGSENNRITFWGAGMVFFAPVVYMLWKWHERAPPNKKLAFKATLALWLAYPAMFFLDDSNAVTPWVYAAVDVAAKAGVGSLIVWS